MNSKGEILVSFPGYSNSLKNSFSDLLTYIATRCYDKKVSFNSFQTKKHCRK